MDNVKFAKCLESIQNRLYAMTIGNLDVSLTEAKEVYYDGKSIEDAKYTKDSLCKLVVMNNGLVELWNDIHDLRSALINFDL